MYNHILQSPAWAEFKRSYGTPAILAGGVVYTKHVIPFTQTHYAYCPRVNPFTIDFDKLKDSLKENKCININFDVPNVTVGSQEELEAIKIIEKRCVKAPRDQFAKGNMFMDLTKSEDELLAGMTTKQKYNIRYAEKNQVVVKIADLNSETDFDDFYKLYDETGKRQHVYFRSRAYLKSLWDIFKNNGMAQILTASLNNKPLASWMLFFYENVMYFPYGGSTEEHKNLQASCLVGWESMKYGKAKGMKLFDMWGAAYDIDDEKDPYHGFTVFKRKFGATHVKYIDSYDMVINEPLYKMFNTANSLRWKVLNFLR